MERLSAYPAYKDSGVPWLGQVPTHWQIIPGLAAYRLNQQKNTGMVETTVLSLSYGRIVVKPLEKLHGLVPASFETYQIVDPGNIIIRPTDLQNDHTSLRVGQAKDRGIITSAYLCLRPSELLCADYAYYVLDAYDLMKVFYGMGSGLRQNLDFSDLRRMPVLLPPKEEQTAIARYLDHADRQIRRFIRAKRRTIELLNEQKQAIIHQAVTRGLDPNVPHVDSQLFWLLTIPKHWEIMPVKQVFECLNHRRIPLNGTERERMTSRVYDYYGASGVIDQVEDYIFDDELLLIAEDGANLLLRNLPLAITARGKFWVNNHAHILKPRNGNFEFWAYMMERIDYTPWITGAAQPKLTQERLFNIRIPVPAQSEQDAIVDTIKQLTSPLSISIERTRREIDLIREYRTRLIADVVTGKIDVRAAAQHLPSQVDEAELWDEDTSEDEENIEEVEEAFPDDDN